jgi:uncharacterized protein YciI
MKHFIILIHYKKSVEEIDKILPLHREYLQKGYKEKLLLFSGPRIPRKGGIVAARAEDINTLKTFFDNDPYYLNSAAEYEFIEFKPVNKQDFLSEWFS